MRVVCCSVDELWKINASGHKLKTRSNAIKLLISQHMRSYLIEVSIFHTMGQRIFARRFEINKNNTINMVLLIIILLFNKCLGVIPFIHDSVGDEYRKVNNVLTSLASLTGESIICRITDIYSRRWFLTIW